MKHFLLFYEKVADFALLQQAFAQEHRAHLDACDCLLAGGNLQDPRDGGALLLFACESAAVVEDFARRDPYVTGGVVSSWRVRGWDVVVGSLSVGAG